MKIRSGFTVVELVVVIAIVIILVALTFPVLVQAKRSAQKTASVQKLRQVWITLQMYRESYDGDGKYGTPAEMGLPEESPYGAPSWFYEDPPCGYAMEETPFYLMCLCSSPDMVERAKCTMRISKETQSYRDNWPLLIDDNCTDRKNNVMNKFQDKTAIGFMLGGSMRVRTATGDHYSPSWWSDPE